MHDALIAWVRWGCLVCLMAVLLIATGALERRGVIDGVRRVLVAVAIVGLTVAVVAMVVQR